MNPKTVQYKWWITIAIAAVLVISGIVLAITLGGETDQPIVETPKESPIGVYYYDTAEGEYLLTLSQGNVFMISGPSLNKSGKCVVTDSGIELDFVKDEDGTGAITIDGDVLNLQYKDKTMRFLEKKTYKVSFNANGGSEVAAMEVVNGKTAAKPADPRKDGSVFIGWYADEACTELYGFGSEVITADTTVYAKWAETVVGQNEYTVSFDLCYEAEGYEAMSTIGGKLYNVPVPARDGFTFAGWWVSQTQNAEQLTIPYVEDMVFQANTTLFALWTTAPEGGKLAAPMVEVYGDSIKWNTVQGASAYQLTILDAEGNVIHDEKLGATTENFDFATRKAGEYTVQVTALASVEEKSSETTTRTFINKALDRVSLFTVIDGGILLWNGVEGAEKYLITIDCGNDAHKHTAFDNGDSTTFMFANCAMQEGGIKFTVTAVADGMASSVSETFVYDRKLDAVGEILYNEETQSFYWDAVANAAKYSITVKVGDKTFTVDNGSATTFSAKYLSGDITLEIVPMTQGYNSPEATTTTYKKTSLATPEGLMVKGNILTWNAVEGATGYMVKINNQSFQAAENSLDLTTTTLTFDSSTTYDICVMAVGTESSLYSDAVTMKYLAPIEQVTYKNNTVTWTPVMGVENYEVRVNGGETITVSGANFTKVVLTKAGINTIEVRYTDLGGSVWTSTEVFAYEVIYNSRSLSGTKSEYLAMGDTMTLPQDFTQDGYDFTGWYNAPEAANGLGAAVTDTQFSQSGTTILYANWTPKVYQIEFVGMTGVTNIAEGDKQAVTYKDGYQLPIPEAPDTMGEFMGWYTGPGGSGVMLTDDKGNSRTDYAYTRDTVAYPAFDNGILEYILQADGTYAVTAGPNIQNVTTVTIPEYYENIPVTRILENAFNGYTNIEKIVIPATIEVVGVGAIQNHSKLQEINVYTDVLQQNYEVFYSSHDGALLRHDMGTTFLEIFPRGKTGEYTIPDNVDVIRNNVFRWSKITKLTVGTGVTLISRRAFYSSSNLEILEFKAGGTDALTIDPEAFYYTTNLTTLRLPARLAEMDLHILNNFTRLTTIEVEAGGTTYSSMDNMICNAAGTAILYAPLTVSGEYTIPVGIREIGPMAFINHTNLTKIIIPSYVNKIGESAFEDCNGLIEVAVEGNRGNDLLIDQKAFFGCDRLKTVTFQGSNSGKLDTGVITIGISAFEGNSALVNLVYENGANVGKIGDRAFADCVQLDEAYIPASATEVGNGAFSGCEGVAMVTFAPNGKEVTFCSNVFEGCKRLTTVNLPATIGSFNSGVFAGCDAITEIIVDAGNPNFITYNGALYSAGYEEILFYPKALSGDLSTMLHPDLKKIGNNVFQNNPKITTIEISEKIVSIGDYAFENCYNMTGVTFKEGSTAMTIGANAFASCDALTAIALPAVTTYIGDSAFESTPLAAFVIPENVTYLGAKALKGTKITAIQIPANVETIGEGAFVSAPLTAVTFVEGTKPLTIGTLGNDVSATAKRTFGVFYGTKITKLELPDRVVSIGDCAFYNVTTLTSVTMNQTSQLKVIGQYAFSVESGTSKLTSVTLGGNLETISIRAFYKAKMTSIVIPKSVTLVGQYAFANTNLKTVNFEFGGTAGLTIESSAFVSSKLTEVNLPARLTTAYSWYTTSYMEGRYKNFTTLFTSNTSLKAINVEPGGEYFTSIDGIVYEVDENGIASTLLYCPMGKTGNLIIPKTVRKVENGAFYNTKLSSIVFEEYDVNDPNYGQPLLEVGTAEPIHIQAVSSTYAVFNGSTLSKISFPSHLKILGSNATYNLNKVGVAVIFNMDAHLEAITGMAFTYSHGITELNLPAVDYIGMCAFFQNNKLAKLTIDPASKCTAIPDYMVRNCPLLTTFQVPASVTRIGMYAFEGCTALASITFAENSQLKIIREYAFSNSGLVEITMPDTLEFLGEAPFQDCKNLKTVTLSKNLATLSLEYGPFYKCPALENVFVHDENRLFKSVDGVLYDWTQTILYCFPAAKDAANVQLPDTLSAIEASAFYGFRGNTIVLPDSIESIGSRAFMDTGLKSIIIPENVMTIGDYAFAISSNSGDYLNLSLESITFAPESKLTSIGQYAFQYNNALKRVQIPDNVDTIGRNAFEYCSVLEEVVLPAALKRIEIHGFYECGALKQFVMQEGLEYIGGGAIAMATTINAKGLKELTVPATVTSIDNTAFACQSLLEKVTFAEGSRLESLGTTVFKDCAALQEITLPATLHTLVATESRVTTINNQVIYLYASGLFMGCSSLKYIDMSACAELRELPVRIFADCVSIETMLLPPNLETIGDFVFNGGPDFSGGKQVYQGTKKLKEITIPASVTSIGSYAFANCESLETVIFEEENTITQLGGIEPTNGEALYGQCMFANTPALRTVVLPKNLEVIGMGCFENSGVAQMVLPASVTAIGARAFYNCDNIVDSGLSANLQYLGDEAFADCNSLQTAELFSGLEYLGSQAFANCEQLKKAYIPATVTSLDGNPFAGCGSVESFELAKENSNFVVKDGILYDKTMYTLIYYPASLTAETFRFPDSVHEIGKGAFAGSKLKSMVIPDRFKQIPSNAFQRSALESVTFHRGITAIGDYAFEGCKNLNNVNMLNNITGLGTHAFANCTSLNSFVFEDTVAGGTAYSIGTHFFDGCTAMTQMSLPNNISVIPAYMFANTGIVHAVIPARITKIDQEGVFYGCKQLETVTFENMKLSGNVGTRFFYGCSKLKELAIPAGISNPLPLNGECYAYCSSLEKLTIYTASTSLNAYGNMEGCGSLKEIEVLYVSGYITVDGVTTGYKTITPRGFAILRTNLYKGTGVKYVYFAKPYENGGVRLWEPAFAGSSVETVVFEELTALRSGSPPYTGGECFSGTTNLKNVWFGTKDGAKNLYILDAAFMNLDTDINFYFYKLTYEEVVKLAGTDAWFKNADEKAHFYFKDTIPEGTEIPEDVLKNMT